MHALILRGKEGMARGGAHRALGGQLLLERVDPLPQRRGLGPTRPHRLQWAKGHGESEADKARQGKESERV